MPWFRSAAAWGPPEPLTPAAVSAACIDLTRPANFFVAPSLRLSWQHQPDEESFWEVFHGRLLDRTQTRQRRRHTAWNVYALGEGGERSVEPMVAVKWDVPADRVFVVRAILYHAHEAFDGGGNVVLTREVVKWQRELVGEID